MSTQNGTEADLAVEEMNENQPPFLILAQYVRDLSFENPEAVVHLTNPEAQLEPEMTVDIKIEPLTKTDFQVFLLIGIKATDKTSEKTAYLTEIEYVTAVRVLNVPEDSLMPFLHIEIPRLAFPFIRTLIANLVREGGYPVLLVPPIDFVEIFKHRIERIREHEESQKEGQS